MTDPTRSTNDRRTEGHQEVTPRTHRGLRTAVQIQLAATVGLVAVHLSSFRFDALGFLGLSLGAISIGAAISALVSCGAVERSIVQLAALLHGIRTGREPVGSLSRIGGVLSGVASACHDLAHELRSQKARTAQLEDETRQRIARRTEALERKIGALRQQASRDGLTGLYNRRSLDEYLPEAVERCRAAGAPLSVLMIDIDYFKPLNDTLGHAAGDKMLKSVAQLIRSTVRENDLAFRCGGDEFVVVLEECDQTPAGGVAARLSALGDSLGRTFRLDPPPALSIGLTTLTTVKEQTAEALLAGADAALYRVKSARHAAQGTTGRSRIPA